MLNKNALFLRKAYGNDNLFIGSSYTFAKSFRDPFATIFLVSLNTKFVNPKNSGLRLLTFIILFELLKLTTSKFVNQTIKNSVVGGFCCTNISDVNIDSNFIINENLVYENKLAKDVWHHTSELFNQTCQPFRILKTTTSEFGTDLSDTLALNAGVVECCCVGILINESS